MSQTKTQEAISLRVKIDKALAKEQAGEDVVQRYLDLLGRLSDFPMSVDILRESKIGATVSKIRKHKNSDVATSSKQLIKKWKKLATAQMEGGSDPKPLAKQISTESVDSVASNSNNGSTKAETPSSEDAPSAGLSTEEEKKEEPAVEAPPAEAPTQKPDLGSGVPDSRYRVREKLFETLGIEAGAAATPAVLGQLAIDIETAIHGLFVLYSNPNEKKKDYGAKVRQINFNIKKNKELRDRVVSGLIEPSRLVKMEPDDFKTDKEREEKKKIQQEKLEASRLDWNAANQDKLNAQCGITDDSGLFTCSRCKSKKTTHTQKQTRSSDEPMTVFAVCLDCGHRWKFSDSYF